MAMRRSHGRGEMIARMDRRQFLNLTAAVASLASVPARWAEDTAPEIAFTFDDPTTGGGANLSWPQINDGILSALAKHKTKSILFVCGMRVDSAAGRQLIAAWDGAGHGIGNHSYSHLYFNVSNGSDPDGFKKVTLAQFEKDAIKNEPLIRDYSQFVRLFRYPFFKEGDTLEKRDGMRSFLQQRGYRIGRATIDTSDWAIDARLQARAKNHPDADLTGYREFYLQHIWERALFYNSLALRVLGWPVRHTVLLHHSALNAMFLGDLIGMFVARGWNPIDAKWAYTDPVYDRQPNILPAGESLVWALAKETGKFDKELRYPGEDDVYENPKMDALKI
jgi:peptidoglycan/xylan/chitin deacetylase (PgdA/CDA1 family)